MKLAFNENFRILELTIEYVQSVQQLVNQPVHEWISDNTDTVELEDVEAMLNVASDTFPSAESIVEFAKVLRTFFTDEDEGEDCCECADSDSEDDETDETSV